MGLDAVLGRLDRTPVHPNLDDCGLCGSRTSHEPDIGYDIDPSGEERQHLDTCRACGAWRFRIDRIEGFTTLVRTAGKWFPKADGSPI